MTKTELKLKFFGILATDPDIDIKTLVQSLKVPFQTLNKWKTEHNNGITNDALEKVLDTDEIIIRKVAEEVADKIIEVKVKPDEPLSPEEEEKINKKFKAKKTKDIISKISNLQELKTDVQAVAKDLVSSIADRLQDIQNEPTCYDSKDIASLTTALTSIQNAFFNKPTTQIGVSLHTGSDQNDQTLLGFRARMKN